eukprot:3031743-Prymnesium_polylepis.3
MPITRERTDSGHRFYDLNLQRAALVLSILAAMIVGAVVGTVVSGSVPLMDIAALSTIWAVPIINQKLFVMFIYACAQHTIKSNCAHTYPEYTYCAHRRGVSRNFCRSCDIHVPQSRHRRQQTTG